MHHTGVFGGRGCFFRTLKIGGSLCDDFKDLLAPIVLVEKLFN